MVKIFHKLKFGEFLTRIGQHISQLQEKKICLEFFHIIPCQKLHHIVLCSNFHLRMSQNDKTMPVFHNSYYVYFIGTGDMCSADISAANYSNFPSSTNYESWYS